MDTKHTENPLLQTWKTKHATPPFTILKPSHFAPAMQQAMRMAKERIAQIMTNSDTPTFLNTIVALEESNSELNRISGILFNLDECDTNDELSDVVMQLTPEITAFENEMWMNEQLFLRVRQVYERYCTGLSCTESLSPEDIQLLRHTYQAFLRNGVNLSEQDKETFRHNSEELAQLEVRFSKNVLADHNAFALNITDEERLSGIPDDVKAAAHEEAQTRGQQGWTLTLAFPVYSPVMQHADNRKLREAMYRAYNTRGNHRNENDNSDVIRRIVWLRHEQARLLGHPDYLSYRLERTMAKTPARLSDFMTQLINAAYPAAQRDLREVLDFINEGNTDSTPIARWDFNYYAEKLKKARYSFDSELLRPYFQLEKVRDGIFALYGKLYGLSFREVKDIETYHPDVKTFEVWDLAENEVDNTPGKEANKASKAETPNINERQRFMGVLYLDMFPRESKRGGAWMTEFRAQKAPDTRPLIQVVCNFTKPVGDKPALLSFNEVETFMHEMGHAMHGMLSDVHYESLSGTNVYRDFVEMPSQLMENWCREPELLNTFARHYLTGDTIPQEYIDKIKASDNYLSGWLCLRQLNLGLTDLFFHTIKEPLSQEESIDSLERKHMIELLPGMECCNTSTAFTHIFCGGYAASYYSYKWSEMLEADIFQRFRERGIFDHANAMLFRRKVLSKGGTVDPDTLFRDFMGRDPDLTAYLKRDGLLTDL